MGWHIVVTEEMRALGLSGNELMVYALIYGFSQGGQGSFFGSIGYICETCGISRKTAHNILKELVEKGLIVKEEFSRNNNRTIHYKVEGCAKFTQGVCKNYIGGVQNLHTDNIEDIDISPTENIYIPAGKFDFKKSIIALGVAPQVADDWMQVRKEKRAANTETAFKRIEAEISKSGLSANECITIAAENSWQGFRAEWLKGTSKKEKLSVLDNNKKVAEELMRMTMKLEGNI